MKHILPIIAVHGVDHACLLHRQRGDMPEARLREPMWEASNRKGFDSPDKCNLESFYSGQVYFVILLKKTNKPLQ